MKLNRTSVMKVEWRSWELLCKSSWLSITQYSGRCLICWNEFLKKSISTCEHHLAFWLFCIFFNEPFIQNSEALVQDIQICLLYYKIKIFGGCLSKIWAKYNLTFLLSLWSRYVDLYMMTKYLFFKPIDSLI